MNHIVDTCLLTEFDVGLNILHEADVDAVTPVVSITVGWLSSRVVSMLDSGTEGPVFKSQPQHCRVTVLGKLFTPIVPLFTKQQNDSSPLKACEGNCGSGGKQWQSTTGFMTHVTCRLTAKNRDQLRNPTLGNRLWATFTFTF